MSNGNITPYGLSNKQRTVLQDLCKSYFVSNCKLDDMGSPMSLRKTCAKV